MKTKLTKISLLASAMIVSTSLYASEAVPKRTLKTNYQEVYNQTPGSVDNFADMFTEGEFYGRIRSNTFHFRWQNESSSKKTHTVSGLGASIVYKSATLNNFDFTTALYYSRAFFKDSSDPVNALKPGKDTLSRFNYLNTGDKSMSTLGQAYLRYQGIAKTELLLGRQMVETFYTKSNDTKMVPNTFDGVVVATKALPDTAIKLGYLYEQKLRDHTSAHSTLMYGDASSSASTNPQWSENDDTAMHKGLTYSALKAAGKSTDAALIVGDVHNKSIKNLKVDASFYVVPELLSQVMSELNYTFKLGNKFSIAPGVRYIRQFDNGAGKIGGASYQNNTQGYKDPNSLDAQMIAARIVTKIDNYKINLGYSKIYDEADLITPWRGFPTSGYTRSMARYNWRANTQSYRIELQRNSNKSGIYKDVYIQASVLYTDGDDKKAGAHVLDEMYYYAGFVQNVPGLVNLQWRLRLGYTQYLDSDADQYNNLDGRFELNYLF